MNSDSYMEVIGEDLLPDMDGLNLAHNRLSQQNDTPRHVAWKKKHPICVLPHTSLDQSRRKPDWKPLSTNKKQLRNMDRSTREILVAEVNMLRFEETRIKSLCNKQS